MDYQGSHLLVHLNVCHFRQRSGYTDPLTIYFYLRRNWSNFIKRFSHRCIHKCINQKRIAEYSRDIPIYSSPRQAIYFSIIYMLAENQKTAISLYSQLATLTYASKNMHLVVVLLLDGKNGVSLGPGLLCSILRLCFQLEQCSKSNPL